MIGDACEGVDEPCLRGDIVEAMGLDQRKSDRAGWPPWSDLQNS